ncbi:MAG: 4-hydroxybenzoate polyprenyltransferase [Pelagibacterales bacterium]|jgi:4-hydroxybenzoate polyprenyltransferase|nr:4-hydroxybenzoate polyprenyltransferase [Pelagibacterales bacterium]
MKHLKIFIDLTRLNKPIGFMLLFWPCSWGLSYAYSFNQNLNIFLYYLLLFFLGSVLMRSAGCIFNDIVDKDLDKKVKRTKKRPLASGEISVKFSILYVLLLCLLSFLILIQFNYKTILLGLGSMLLAFSYPFMKRITYWPQLFLGLTFNWGMIMGYMSILDQFSFEIIILYSSAIFWTLGYDTIYGVQDIVDDEIIGIKSTAIKFKDNIKLFVSICYLISFSLMIYVLKENIGINLSTLFIFMFFLSLTYQLKIFEKGKSLNCLKAFKVNNFSGFFMFCSILLA